MSDQSDPSDQATKAEEQFHAQALAKQAEKAQVRSGLKPGDWRKLSAKWCKGVGCGERIPDERRRAVPGVEFCAQCQTRIEEEERRAR